MTDQQSREYVLLKLDNWFARRVGRVFTIEDSSGLFQKVRQTVEELECPKEHKLAILESMSLLCLPENQIKEAGSYFSRGYATLEGLVEGNFPASVSLRDMTEGVKNEHFEKLIEAYSKLGEFVGKVRKESFEVSPEELPEDKINLFFVQTFPRIEDFLNFRRISLEAYLLAVNYLVIKKQVPQVFFDFSKRYLISAQGLSDNLDMRIFWELYK